MILPDFDYELSLLPHSLILGYGLGGSIQLLENTPFFATDAGLSNTLLDVGIIGILSVIAIVITVYKHGFSLLKSLTLPQGQGYVAGLLVAWTVICISYVSFDWFTLDTWVWGVGIVLVLVDRLRFFNLPPSEI